MKIKLLNDGGFEGLESVTFPVVVEAYVSEDGMYRVSFEDIQSLPGAYWTEGDTYYGSKYSFFPDEVEVLP